VKVKLLVDIMFEYAGMRKTLWKAGTVLSAKKLDACYWVTTGERTPVPLGFENPGSLYETNCFFHECEEVK